VELKQCLLSRRRRGVNLEERNDENDLEREKQSEERKREIKGFEYLKQEKCYSMSLNPLHQVQPAPLNVFFCFFHTLFKPSIGFSH
jgi:hypothetical protein